MLYDQSYMFGILLLSLCAAHNVANLLFKVAPHVMADLTGKILRQLHNLDAGLFAVRP